MSMLIGWAEESIVPGKKTRLQGQFYERISEYVESDITVTAMAVESGEEKMILMSADVTSIPMGVLQMAREKFRKICPQVDPNALILAATHTHCAPVFHDPMTMKNVNPRMATARILEEFSAGDKLYKPLVSADDDIATPEECTELFTDKIALAAKRAWENRVEAYYTNEFGRAAVGMCRRVSYDDGSAQMWGDVNTANFVSLEGGNDSGIELLYTFDKNKNLTGVVANIACPSQILEHRSIISADFWGQVKVFLREKFGAHIYLLSLGGAGGDQCPRDLVRWVDPETPVNDPHISRPNLLQRKADPSMFDIKGCRLVGKRIANEIISVFEEITELKKDGVFRHKVINLDLPLRKVTMAEYNEAVRELEYFVNKNRDKECFDYHDTAKMYVYAGTISRYRLQQHTEVYPIEYHVVRLGDIAMTTNPFELFLDFGNRIKARSYAQQTFVIQLCNGGGAYLPTEKAEKGGHYSAYITSGNVGHEGGDLLVRESLKEINEMWEV